MNPAPGPVVRGDCGPRRGARGGRRGCVVRLAAADGNAAGAGLAALHGVSAQLPRRRGRQRLAQNVEGGASVYLDHAIDLVPEEPAGWANRGLLAVRERERDTAAKYLHHALKMAPGNAAIEGMLGQLAWVDRNIPETIAHLRTAVAADPRDVGALYTLAEALHESKEPNAATEELQTLDRILAVQPNNLHVLMKRAELAYKQKDQAAFADTLQRLDRVAPSWQKEAPRAALATLHKAVKNSPGDVEPAIITLRNVLQGERAYARGTKSLRQEADKLGTPLVHFLRLQQPPMTPAPPDRELTFTVGPWAGATTDLEKTRWDALRLVWRITELQRQPLVQAASNGGGYPLEARMLQSAVLLANGREARHTGSDAALPFPGGAKAVGPSPAGVLALDWDNDLRMDLVFAGAGGLRFLASGAGRFVRRCHRQDRAAGQASRGRLLRRLGRRHRDGRRPRRARRPPHRPPLVLRNNRDGTFAPQEIAAFASLTNVRGFRLGRPRQRRRPGCGLSRCRRQVARLCQRTRWPVQPWPLPDDTAAMRFVGATAADVNDDGIFDLVALRSDGAVLRISDQDHRTSWQIGRTGARQGMEGPVARRGGVVRRGSRQQRRTGPHCRRATGGACFSRGRAVPLRGVARDGPHARARRAAPEQRRPARSARSVEGWRTAATAQRRPHPIRLAGVSADRQSVVQQARRVRRSAQQFVRASAANWRCRRACWCRKQPITGPMLHFGLGEQRLSMSPASSGPTAPPQWEFEPPNDRLLIAAQRLPGLAAPSSSPTTARACASSAISCGARRWACTSTARTSAPSRRPPNG